jgi:hypothetical protein
VGEAFGNELSTAGYVVLVSLFQLAITAFDLFVNGPAKLTQSRASGDQAMAVAACRCVCKC